MVHTSDILGTNRWHFRPQTNTQKKTGGKLYFGAMKHSHLKNPTYFFGGENILILLNHLSKGPSSVRPVLRLQIAGSQHPWRFRSPDSEKCCRVQKKNMFQGLDFRSHVKLERIWGWVFRYYQLNMYIHYIILCHWTHVSTNLQKKHVKELWKHTHTHIPRTQMTLVLTEKGLVLEGWPWKKEVSWVYQYQVSSNGFSFSTIYCHRFIRGTLLPALLPRDLAGSSNWQTCVEPLCVGGLVYVT